MKKILTILMILTASASMAADLIVTVPAAAVPDALARCDELRVTYKVRAAEWDNDLCATVFTRLGLRNFTVSQERKDATQTVTDAVQTAIGQFDLDWAEPFVSAYCGDDIIDVEFGEECDDGNSTPGDGCDEQCLNE